MSHERPTGSLKEVNTALDRQTLHQDQAPVHFSQHSFPTRTGLMATSTMLAAPIRPSLSSISSNTRQSLPGLHDLNLLSPSSDPCMAQHARDHDSRETMQRVRNTAPPPSGGGVMSTQPYLNDHQPNMSNMPTHHGMNHDAIGGTGRYSQNGTQFRPPQRSSPTSGHIPRPKSVQALRSPSASEPHGRYPREIQHVRSATTNMAPQHVSLVSPTSSMSMPPRSSGHRRDGSDGGYFGLRPPAPVEQVCIAGKGWVYRYSDGTSVPCEVDGQPVNPHHGITKQGHPRKRGSHACLTCRNKKVKCEADSADPDGPCRACARSRQSCQWYVKLFSSHVSSKANKRQGHVKQ